MGAAWRFRVVGTCYLCRQPVRASEAARVLDVSVSGSLGRRIARLAHIGRCESELRGRIGGRWV
jgi:hypothetical protein